MGRLTELYGAAQQDNMPPKLEQQHKYNYLSFDPDTKRFIQAIRKKRKTKANS